MKKSVILLSLVLFFTACGPNRRYKVQGKLNNSSKELIFLKEMTTVDYIPIDSTRIDKNGKFKLTGKNSKPAFYMLYISKNNYITLIISPGEKVFIIGNAKDLQHKYIVKGSKDSELAKELNDRVNETLKKINNLSKIYDDSLNYGNHKNIMALRSMLLSRHDSIEKPASGIYNKIYSCSSQFIGQHYGALPGTKPRQVIV